jgi:hypothetical protein
MPVERGRDREGPYYRWGKHGAKYRYTAKDPRSRVAARARATRQGQAAHARGYE